MIAHFNAVKARLISVLPAAVTVNDSALVNADGSLVRGQYVILFGGPPNELDDKRNTATQRIDSNAEYLYTVRCVSVTPSGVRGVAQLVLSGLVGFAPTVAGRTCQRIVLDDSTNVEADNTLKPPLWFLDLDFILRSKRA